MSIFFWVIAVLFWFVAALSWRKNEDVSSGFHALSGFAVMAAVGFMFLGF